MWTFSLDIYAHICRTALLTYCEMMMSGLIHDVPVRFRVSNMLLARAQAKALNEGMSLSELMRSALRRELKN